MSSEYPCIFQTLYENISVVFQLPKLAVLIVVAVKLGLSLFGDLVKFLLFLAFLFFLTRCLFRLVETVLPKIDCIVPENVKERIVHFSDRLGSFRTDCPPPPEMEEKAENTDENDVRKSSNDKGRKSDSSTKESTLGTHKNNHSPGSSSKPDTKRSSELDNSSLLSIGPTATETVTKSENLLPKPNEPDSPRTSQFKTDLQRLLSNDTGAEQSSELERPARENYQH